LSVFYFQPMNFTSKQLNQYETVSEILSNARKEKNVDLEKAEKTLKINKKYLRALERGQYDILPSTIYVKNFARAYADYLGLNSKKIIKLVERELGIINQINGTTPTSLEKKHLKNKVLITPKIVRHLLIVILVLACLAYLGWQINTIFSPPPLEIINPQPDLVTNQNFITIEGQTLPEINVTINNQRVLTDRNGYFNKSFDLQTGLNTIEIKARKKHSKASVVMRQIMMKEEGIIE